MRGKSQKKALKEQQRMATQVTASHASCNGLKMHAGKVNMLLVKYLWCMIAIDVYDLPVLTIIP